MYPIPISTYLGLLAALGMTALHTGLTRLLVSPKKLKSLKAELREYEKLFAKAYRAKDEKTRLKVERKLRKRQDHFDRLRGRIMWEQTKSMIIMMASFFVVVFVLAPYFGREPVAYLPIGLSGPLPLNFVFWYAICGMAFGTLIQRALGVSWTE